MYIPLPDNNIACTNCIYDIIEHGAAKRASGYPVEKSQKPVNSTYFESPREIFDLLEQYIVGQEIAKKYLSVTVFNHYVRISSDDSNIEKSNILLIGPSGSGKTSLVKALAKVLGIPIAITSATSLTEAGYIGNDVEMVVQNLFHLTGRDVEKTEHGIIFIDEIDKLSSSFIDSQSTVGHIGVQQALLPILEGCTVSIPYSNSKNEHSNAKVDIDTSNILFICGGAFPNIDKLVSKRTSQKPSIGFSHPSRNDIPIGYDEPIQTITGDDLRAYGIIPELIGRLPVIATLDKLSKESLKKILRDPKNSLITQYRSLFAHMSINLLFKDDALDEIAYKAYIKNTGARALRSVMESLLLELMFGLPHQSDINEVIITKAFVLGLEPPLTRRDIYSQACSVC